MFPESGFNEIGVIGFVIVFLDKEALSAPESLLLESLFASAMAFSFAAFLASSNFFAYSFFKVAI